MQISYDFDHCFAARVFFTDLLRQRYNENDWYVLSSRLRIFAFLKWKTKGNWVDRDKGTLLLLIES